MAELFKALESRDLGFDSQHSQGGSHLSVAPVPGNPSVSSGSDTDTVHRHTCRRNAHTHKIKFKNCQKREKHKETETGGLPYT